MTAYIIRRLWQMIPTLLGVILLVFILFNWVGGDPAYVLAGKISSAEQIENIRRQLGVDQPFYVQLWIFIKQVLTADFGASWSTNEAVSHIMATRLGPSLTVLIPLLIISTLVAIGLALAVAYVRGSLTDRAVMIVCTVGLSISILVYIIVFQYVFAYKLGWFPVQGWGDGFWHNLSSTRRCRSSSCWSSASRPTCGCSARSCSTRSTRTTSAPRAPRACRKTASCGCTCCAMRRSRSSPT